MVDVALVGGCLRLRPAGAAEPPCALQAERIADEKTFVGAAQA